MVLCRQIALLALVSLTLTSLLFAKKQQTQHAPLPAKVLTARTIYIDNQSGWAEAADKAYGQLKAWGKYQIVDAKEKADLILVLTVIEMQQGGQESSWVSTYNSQTGAWTHGTISTPSTNTVRYTEIRLIDPATGDMAWADRLIWSRKRSATEMLIQSLRQRVEEQERQSSR
jgi:hypothetical protein